jgi:hypothetical protein
MRNAGHGCGGSILTEREVGFLVSRGWREESRELTQQLVLGYGIGFLLIGSGAYKYFMSVGAWDAFWKAAMWAGGLAVLATLIMPSIWRTPEALIRKVGNWIGHRVFSAILAVLYFVGIWPVGAFLRATKGSHPIYLWNDQHPAVMEGWTQKRLPYDVPADGSGRTSRRRSSLFTVLSFFVRRGYFIFVPILLILVSLGIALFFLQTSALAPFIYTLF